MQGYQNKNREHNESRCTVYLDLLKDQDYNSNIFIEGIRFIDVITMEDICCITAVCVDNREGHHD